MNERDTWNTLYRRTSKSERPPAEVDSVPSEQDWGAPEAFTCRDCYRWLLPYIPERGAVLAGACGNGSFLGSVVRAFPGISGFGFDIADAAIEIARGHAARLGIEDRFAVHQGSFHDQWNLDRRFDLVFSLTAMQFTTRAQIAPLMSRIKARLVSGGTFCCEVRSTSRAVPDSYAPVPDKPDTYVSGEAHELGMTYHHYSRAELDWIAKILGGELVYRFEKHEYREYDPFPERAWWRFAIRVD